MNERTNEQTNERKNEWMKEWIITWSNEWTNAWMNFFFLSEILSIYIYFQECQAFTELKITLCLRFWISYKEIPFEKR